MTKPHFATASAAERNLLLNPEFREGAMTGWTDRSVTRQNVGVVRAEELPGDVRALKVEVVKDGGSSHGQILQFAKARSGVAFRLDGKVDVQDSGSVVRGADGLPLVRLRNPSREADAAAGDFDSLSHPDAGYRGSR
jgi:hypothetical protein